MLHSHWLKELFVDPPVEVAPEPVQADPSARFDASPILIAFATQNGAAQDIAEATLEQLEMAGNDVQMIDFYDMTLDVLEQAGQVLFVSSTTYDGEPPDMAEEFCNQVMATPAELGQLHYALLALGDRSYDFFCGFGHRLDDWLRASGAHPWFNLIEVDDEDEQAIERWYARVAALAEKPTD